MIRRNGWTHLRQLLAPWLLLAPCAGVMAAGAEATPAASPPTAGSPKQPSGATSSETPQPAKQRSPAPADADRGAIKIHRDLTYCEIGSVQLTCDLYLPAADESAADQASCPVVVVVHGGGWASGDKWTIGGYGQSLARAGMAAVVVNYRFAPEHRFPAQVDDVRSALLWVADHADHYGWDLRRLGIFGYSAGAHLACMLGTLCDAPPETRQDTSQWPADDSRWDRLPQVAAVAAGGAPCEFRSWPLDNTALTYFLGATRREAPGVYQAASPAAYASAGDCPTLFFHGDRDLIVPASSSRALFDAQVAAGVASEYLKIEGQGHMVTFLHPTATAAVVRFLSQHLRP